ncbi:uncharacterized protein F5891DRAFT_983440 [Suillus fuscotomentosus]|uniref:Uncharacterized protein n=1 Tax=Suillus fuscotomentosus TaxID=1912939 RepID=A0AAD4DZC0_9AGAM|nr:uncharacterized protein F5891DRAFT_983440 [Suillus fuscotomentosus]KAG1896432.1 hypothetical protein F5891DRAFT_983440 [Suillus fuscotomentosus]
MLQIFSVRTSRFIVFHLTNRSSTFFTLSSPWHERNTKLVGSLDSDNTVIYFIFHDAHYVPIKEKSDPVRPRCIDSTASIAETELSHYKQHVQVCCCLCPVTHSHYLVTNGFKMMPHRDSDGEDFEAELNAVSDAEDSDSEGLSDDDLGTLRAVLTVPQPDAPMHEVRKPDVDPRSSSRWASPEAKLDGSMAELYQCVPQDLHKSMEKYTAFDSLFRAAVSAERSNIVHAIKSCAGIIFSDLKLDPSLFASQTDSLVLVKIICVEIFGKKVLSGKIKGQKARGQRCNVQCVTKGLIAGAAVMARFLLTHDPEFTATGAETKINYQADYDFYLERLFKRTPWACSVMNFFNKEVFNITSPSHAPASDDSYTIPQPRTWEDDLLDELDAPIITQVSTPTTRTPSPAASSAIVDVTSSYHTSMSINQGQSVSTTSQLQLGVSRLSLGNHEPPVSGTHSASSRQFLLPVAQPPVPVTHSASSPQSRLLVPEPSVSVSMTHSASSFQAQLPVPEPPFVSEPDKATRVTHHGSTRAVAPTKARKGKGKR